MFCEAPRPTMYSSHLEKPRAPVNCARTWRMVVSVSAARILSLTGPNEAPSPWMAVVIPWVTMEIALPSPRM